MTDWGQQATRNVTAVVKDIVGHSQRNAWCLAAAAICAIALPPYLAWTSQPYVGPLAASRIYMHGYGAEAAILGVGVHAWKHWHR